MLLTSEIPAPRGSRLQRELAFADKLLTIRRLFSVGLGRPSSTPKSSISCPKPSIDTNEEYTPWLPTPDTSPSENILGMHSHISSTACHVSETYTIACEAMDIM